MDVNKAYELATGLRGLAEFIGDNASVLPEVITIECESWINTWDRGVQPKEDMALILRAGMAHEGCSITKEYSDYAFRLALEFSPSVICKVKTQRDAVCTRTVTGTEEYEVEEPVGDEPELVQEEEEALEEGEETLEETEVLDEEELVEQVILLNSRKMLI